MKPKTFTILIVAALPAELKSIKEEVKKLGLVGIKIRFFLGGVGNYTMLYNLTDYFNSNQEEIDFIINIGLCGKISLSSSDIFQVYRILGAANEREVLCPIYIDYLKKQSLLSSEQVITSEKDMQGEKYVDMESYAVDVVATKKRIPYIIVKKPFDTVSLESKKIEVENFKNCLQDIEYQKLLEMIILFLKKNEDPQKEIQSIFLSKTLKIYNFSFSEIEIWKKSYAKYVSFGGDYRKFLEENKSLIKKDFLKKLGT